MNSGSEVTFAIQIAPTGTKPDHELYAEVVEDCKLAVKLGYEGAWMLEHHFSDYNPTPSPLVFLAHIAAACPTLSLGTSVLVLPWYHPLRLAAEISMLNALTEGNLYIGVGRGTAKLEYDAYGIDMREARARFAEVYKIMVKALEGRPFTYDGKFHKIARPVRLRPTPAPKPVHFFGAIGSPESAEIMADLGMPPIASAFFPDATLKAIPERWRTRAATHGRGHKGIWPITVRMFLGDTDEEAFALGRKYFPPYFKVQTDHYEIDMDPWDDIPDYVQFTRLFKEMKKMENPANLQPVFDTQLVGGPERVSARLKRLVDLGYDYVVIAPSITGVPKEVRQDQFVRFARDVAPRFSSVFREKTAAAAE
ncbi:MAG: LLM class flavin-dependent oxidoreductase [Alphaproteobacteria bacterium]|nr:LLM class flavin-dependent oxidoreductase [Alphaproteobacteria bacterium]